MNFFINLEQEDDDSSGCETIEGEEEVINCYLMCSNTAKLNIP